MSEKQFKAETKKDTGDIEAKEVILNIQRAAKDMDQVINEEVRQKYPHMHIAKPSQKEAREGHRGWKYLKFDSSTLTVREVDSIDQADTTSSNVLCWRKKEIQQYIDDQERRARELSRQKAKGESTKTQAQGLNEALAGMGQGKIRARPLEAEDLED